MSYHRGTGITNAQFPSWVVRKIGEPLHLEADWNYAALPNGKYGAFLDGASTLSVDTSNFFVGGKGSCKMLTDAVASHNSEVKINFPAIILPGDLLSFEQKWCVPSTNNNTTQYHMGIEVRSHTQILHARFRWSKSLGSWQIENADTSYSDFSALTPALVKANIEAPQLQTATGNIPGWCRIVVDPFNLKTVSFETHTLLNGNSNLTVYDLRPYNFALVVEGASTVSQLMAFVLTNNGTGAAADSIYTTDWCMARIPKGIDPI